MLKIVHATEIEALLHFNLAPLSTRRDIAMLGLIHRAAIGRGPVQLHGFFRKSARYVSKATRLQLSWHDAQLVEYRNGSHTEYVKRSALGLVSVYNLLPCYVLALESVSVFQGALQNMLKMRATTGVYEWPKLFSPRWDLTQHPLAG